MCRDCVKSDKKRKDNETARHLLRFSGAVSEALLEWVRTHQENPYPNAADKARLQEVTGLDARQLNTWFANYRRRKQAELSDRNAPGPIFQLTTGPVRGGLSTHADGVAEQSVPRQSQQKKFQCTFCTDTFTTKYDWTRHELSLHLPLKRYICCAFSAVQQCPDTGSQICAYCGLASPTAEHTASHNHHQYCQSREPDARIFLRKDHLRQHLQSVHECDMLPHMDYWLLEAVWINSRCGFCGQRFTMWSDRNQHIASHYKSGYHMGMWKGCRGLDCAVSAQVTAAMPPFLIGLERLRPFPFSASKAKRHPGLPHNRSWEFLVVGLNRLIKQKVSQSRPVSDQELQAEARFLTYGSANADISTAADNPEWLDLFKKAHSLDILACLTEGQDPRTADDLEVYHDLGISIPPLSQEQHTSALFALFQGDGPTPKAYLRFSASRVPLHKALPFETIAGPWPAAGRLGDTLIVAEWVFRKTLGVQLSLSLIAPGLANEWPWTEDEENEALFSGSLLLPWEESLDSEVDYIDHDQNEMEPRIEALN
jgi:hypothetical protein